MNDIIERLRSWASAQTNHPNLLREAADEIERLNAHINKLDDIIAKRDARCTRLETEIERWQTLDAMRFREGEG